SFPFTLVPPRRRVRPRGTNRTNPDFSCKEQLVPTDPSDPVPSSVRLPLAAAVLAAIGGFTSMSASAQTPRDIESNRDLPTIVVVGKAQDATDRQPAAVSLVTPEALRLRHPRSTEEALRAVPGVAIK